MNSANNYTTFVVSKGIRCGIWYALAALALTLAILALHGNVSSLILLAYAEPMQGADTNGIAGTAASAPHAFSRGVTESISVSSVFGNGPASSGQAYSRALSDSVGITTGTGPNNGYGRSAETTSNNPSMQNARSDERSSSRASSSGKNDSLEHKPSTKSAAGNSVVQNTSREGSRCLTGNSVESFCADESDDGEDGAGSSNLCTFEFLGNCVNLPILQDFSNSIAHGMLSGTNLSPISHLLFYGAPLAVVSVPISQSRGRPIKRIIGIAIRVIVPSGFAAGRGRIRTVIILIMILLAIPSSLYLPPAYGSTVKIDKVVGNHATDTFVADANVPSNTVIATYTRSDTGSTVYTVTKADIGTSLTGNVGNAVTITFTFVQTITSSTGLQYQFMSWTLGGSGWGTYTDGQSVVHCATNTTYTTLTDTCASTNNGGGNSGGPVATYGFKASPADTLTASPSVSGVKSNLYTRSITESTPIISSVGVATKIVGRGISDPSLSVADSLSAKVTGRAISDAISFSTTSDSLSAKITGFGISEPALSLSDSISTKVGRTLIELTPLISSDNIAIRLVSLPDIPNNEVIFSDSISTKVGRTLIELTPLISSDSVVSSLDSSRTFTSDSLSFGDLISSAVTRDISDSTEARVSDEIMILLDTSRYVSSDQVAISDGIGVNVSRSTGISESAGARVSDSLSIKVNRILTESSPLTASDNITINVSRAISDAISLSLTADGIYIDAGLAPTETSGAKVLDSVSASLLSSRNLTADELSVSDTVYAAVSGISIFDSAGARVSDSVSTTLGNSRSLTADELNVSDSISASLNARTLDAEDSLGINSQLSVRVIWNKNFEEALNLQECTPFTCNAGLRFDEGLGLADEYVPPPVFNDTVSISDHVSTGYSIGTTITDSLGIGASTNVLAKPTPPPSASGSPLDPISVLVVTNTTIVGHPPSVHVNIDPLTWNGDIQTLKDTLKPTPHVINATVSRADLPKMFITLPTYYVPLKPSGQNPAKDVVMSVMAAEIPRNSTVYVPINVENTPGLDTNKGFTKSMSIEFTPNVDTRNFALVVQVVNSPPQNATPPPADLKPLYLDVKWMGDFPGTEDPSVKAYYKNPPKFTFTVTDSWATEQNSERDGNGVPSVSLLLLNESAGIYEPLTTITRPIAAVDGVYTYVATLEHFSNYAIVANKVTASYGGSYHPPSPTSSLAVDLAESLGIADKQNTVPLESLEEFGQKTFKVRIAESIIVLAKPVSYKTFQVGEIDVKISLQDIKQEGIIPPKAAATFLVEMTNSGGKDEQFTLNFWYYGDDGKKAYETSQLAKIRPFESKQLVVSIPFTSPGTFDVTAEARSFPTDDLVTTTQLTATIPWLTINLYVLIIVATVIVGVSGAGLAIILSRMGALAAGGSGLALLFLKKARPTVKVTENIENVGDCDLLVHARLAEGAHAQKSSASVDIDIINRSKRKQVFVLSYKAMDESGIKIREISERVTIEAQKSSKTVAKLDLPKGSYILIVEAKPTKGDEIWSQTDLHIKVL